MGSAIRHRRRQLLWAVGLGILACAFVGIEWGTKAAAIRAQAIESDRLHRTRELTGKLRTYGYGQRHDLEQAINQGRPLPAMEIDGPYGRAERVVFDASLLGARYAGWTVRFDFHPWGRISTLQVTPPALRTEGIWGGLGDPSFQMAAIRIRQVLLVLCAAAWVTLAVLVPFAGIHRRQLGSVMMLTGIAAFLAWMADPGRAGLWSIPPFGALPAAALTGIFVGLVVRVLPSRRSTIAIGRCACGYNLTGNISGVCPECGRPTPQELRRRRDAELAPIAQAIGETHVEPEDEFETQE